MVSTNQSAFIKGRFIQNNFMLVQQTTRFLHSQKQPRILLKLDITKAFDLVSWYFLQEVLEKKWLQESLERYDNWPAHHLLHPGAPEWSS
jgi:hypothetical protein